MTVVCNATPLINFAAINRLDILQAVFGQIFIPQAVYNETTDSPFRSSKFVLQAISSGWLQVNPVLSIPLSIPLELDIGEREAIALALETGEEQILLDEREASLTLTIGHHLFSLAIISHSIPHSHELKLWLRAPIRLKPTLFNKLLVGLSRLQLLDWEFIPSLEAE